MKLCTKCKREKPYKEFSKDSKTKSGRRSNCKDCESTYKKQYRTSKTGIETRRAYRSSIREWLVDLKKTLKCEICKESRHYVLDFHHKNPLEKDFNIARAFKNSSKETIMKEIEKCMVVCSNCHREIHWLESHPTIVPMKINITLEHLWEEN